MAFAGSKLSLADFEVGVMLGRGAFGRVHHAKHMATGRYYALKCLAKQALLAMPREIGESPTLRNLSPLLSWLSVSYFLTVSDFALQSI